MRKGGGDQMKKIYAEVLVEDRSGSTIVAALLKQEIALLKEERRTGGATGKTPDLEVELAFRPHRGIGRLPRDVRHRPAEMKGGLLDLFPAKCRAYEKVLDTDADVLILCFDSDRNDPALLEEAVRTAAEICAPALRTVIGIAVEELEAWLLGDPEALRRAYPDLDEAKLSAYEQDAVCGTWETLCAILEKEEAEEIIASGYPAVGRFKAEWARRITPYMKAESNRSPSYRRFRARLRSAFFFSAPRKPDGAEGSSAASVRENVFCGEPKGVACE